MRIMFVCSMVCMLLNASSFLLMPYTADSDGGTLVILTALLFWLPLVAGQVLIFAVDRVRRKTQESFGRTRRKLPGVIRFFENKWALIADIACALSLIGFTVSVFADSGGYSNYVLLFFLVFTFQLHCVLNGENYKFIISYKERNGTENGTN